ncbi:MAG: GPR endopeptidase [Ruminococcaceae bacterium]|nr:GPR endopeptidase [Oscillospiraceae bacterium]
MKNYIVHTDLACESELMHDKNKAGTDYSEEIANGFKVAKLSVKSLKGEIQTGKKCGNYITIFSEMINNIDGENFDALTKTVSDEIGAMMQKAVPQNVSCVLVAGLGNREITADNIGPKTVDRLTVTRHIEQFNKNLFDSFCKVPLCAVAPGVLGQTGIETAEMIRGVCERVHPDIVIAIDALAARSTARLGATVQISDTGIFPGSGIGNRRNEISRATLGIPVIAVGVPTVVNSATLVYDALTSAGFEKIDSNIKQVLHDGESFFVSPRQSDLISDKVSELLAAAIDNLFLRKE